MSEKIEIEIERSEKVKSEKIEKERLERVKGENVEKEIEKEKLRGVFMY